MREKEGDRENSDVERQIETERQANRHVHQETDKQADR